MIDMLLSAGAGIVKSMIGGKGGGSSSNAMSAAELAATQKIGFASERQVAMQASRDAANLSSRRTADPSEGRAEDTKYKEEIVRLLQGIRDTRVREALIDQAMRQGKIDHPKLLEGMAGTAESYETTVKPQKIESA
jgi:hypothetical protein